MSGDDERRGSSPGRGFHERHEPYAWHEPTDPPEPREDHHEQHAGNGTVNHRPEDQGRPEAGPEHDAASAETDSPGAGRGDLPAGRDRLAAVLGGIGTGGTRPDFTTSQAQSADDPETALDGLGSDERALRRMLHEAVRDIEPREGGLQHLRRAVPARRARKRQAVIGMAAAALFVGTAIPAVVHVSNATGSHADPSIAGHASQAQGGTGQGKGPDGGSSGPAGSSGTTKDKSEADPKGKEDTGKGASEGATDGAQPTASAQSAPACTATQLGGATASVGAPSSTGTVYGSFRVTNVSATSCTVSGVGSVSTVAQDGADPAKISVLAHVAGDAATELPEPSQDVTSLVLGPGAAYEIKFAWVPSETCPTTGGGGTGGGTGGESPDPSPTVSSSESSGTNTQSGDVTPQLVTGDGVTDGSVLVSHTPATGSGTSSATIPNACAGTVYHTGILTAS
ncbi:hypothetical protein [Streptomyces colonosanans]|uniref:DUF4232 domain-containing protein n=1 Tax=Streptomyces colonosanans TaxID=1428652 RepID=A0A1S2P9U3_9ACTN|nr:hypothetical protein [Streptomyces colonosanans]OIJ89794.1 hypothetical protein BIV24_19495 [Streptomyces colonosanans]